MRRGEVSRHMTDSLKDSLKVPLRPVHTSNLLNQQVESNLSKRQASCCLVFDLLLSTNRKHFVAGSCNLPPKIEHVQFLLTCCQNGTNHSTCCFRHVISMCGRSGQNLTICCVNLLLLTCCRCGWGIICKQSMARG